jgi:hypothetical protein
MNQSLKSKRDEFCKDEATITGGTPEIIKEHYVERTWDAAIQAVIKLLGEFDEDAAIVNHETRINDSRSSPIDAYRWQHEQMLNKLRGES